MNMKGRENRARKDDETHFEFQDFTSPCALALGFKYLFPTF